MKYKDIKEEFYLIFDLKELSDIGYDIDKVWSWVEKALDNNTKRVKKEIIEKLKKMKTYPDKPCPACGGKVIFGASDRNGMKYGCYDKKCPRVKKWNYFNVIVTPEMEQHNQTLDQAIKAIK